jgi:arabinoxylan arabinofuranohydrolase
MKYKFNFKPLLVIFFITQLFPAISFSTTNKNKNIERNNNNKITQNKEKNSDYLFVYFTGNSGNEEAIRFAISPDGYNYRALNNNNPIISSDTISYTGGVRDPHILRGIEGNFYMVATDMKSDSGWSSNHGIILFKSSDLINWKSSKIDIRAKYPDKFGKIESAWAPQTIYDSQSGKYMIYWSMRSPGVNEIIYYAYANTDFTDIESEPKVLFNHPDSKSTIDPDIIFKDGKYNLFFKTEGDGNGIKKAVSDKLTGQYQIQDKYLQQTKQAVEGSCIFKLINSDSYILMYDVYTNGRYEFTESTDLMNFHKIDDYKITMNFHPRHGTVLTITREESKQLVKKWGKSLPVEILSSASSKVKRKNIIKDENSNEVFLPVRYGTKLTCFDPEFTVLPETVINPDTPCDFTKGTINYTLNMNGQQKTYRVAAQINNNPVLDGFYADPQIMYSEKTHKYYIYPTSDGFEGWGGYYFKAFSSEDLVNWTDEGIILDLSANQAMWANGNAWAPAIIEKHINGRYKYYFYYCGNSVSNNGKQIGVAVSDSPTGPFVDSGKAMITSSPTGNGQQIDPAVFKDPVSGKNYIFWGNGYMAGAELNDDMISIKQNTIKVMTPDNTFREGIYVIYRKGIYYFFWSEDDTGNENYKVRYGTSYKPLGDINIPKNNIVIQKNVSKEIYATGHNSILQIPGKDEWYIVYHRFARPKVNGAGYHREVCIDNLKFNEDGSIEETIPTLEGITISR